MTGKASSGPRPWLRWLAFLVVGGAAGACLTSCAGLWQNEYYLIVFAGVLALALALAGAPWYLSLAVALAPFVIVVSVDWYVRARHMTDVQGLTLRSFWWLGVTLCGWACAGAAALGLLAGWVLRRALRLAPKADDSVCCKCGYCLIGNVSGRCPECGTPIADAPRDHWLSPSSDGAPSVDRSAHHAATPGNPK